VSNSCNCSRAITDGATLPIGLLLSSVQDTRHDRAGHHRFTGTLGRHHYRCLGADNYRYENGRVCDNKPVRTDYLDTLVWDHITGLLANPTLIRAEIDRRLDQLRTADPTTAQRQHLKQALAKASTSITRLIKAHQEELISLDELRECMPELRSRETSLRNQLDALTAQLVDREAYLQLATGLEDFLTQLRTNAGTTTIPEQQRVLRLLVKDVLIGPERILIRHSIPTSGRTTNPTPKRTHDEADEEPSPSSSLCWRSQHTALGPTLVGRREPAVLHHPGLQPPLDRRERATRIVSASARHSVHILTVKRCGDAPASAADKRPQTMLERLFAAHPGRSSR
jgi:site-specific DNA recombinase